MTRNWFPINILKQEKNLNCLNKKKIKNETSLGILQSNSGGQQLPVEQAISAEQCLCDSSLTSVSLFGFGDNTIMVIACVWNYSLRIFIKSCFSVSSFQTEAFACNFPELKKMRKWREIDFVVKRLASRFDCVALVEARYLRFSKILLEKWVGNKMCLVCKYMNYVRHLVSKYRAWSCRF